MEKKRWVYEISLNGRLVGEPQGDGFDTKEEALADAHDLIISELSEEYEVPADKFKVEVFEGNIMVL